MKIEVSKTRVTILMTVLLLLLGSVAVWAYNANYPTAAKPVGDVATKVGHSPDEIEVDLGADATKDFSCTGKITLYDAVRNKCLGGGTTGGTGGTTGTTGFTNMQIFDTSGLKTWTKPEGVTKFMVELWGAGGGGGGGSTIEIPCVAGGGGGYGKQIFSNVPAAATTYTLNVGAGGKSGYRVSSDASFLATNGGDTTITVGTSTISARGGKAPDQSTTIIPFGGRGGDSDATFSVRGGNGLSVVYAIYGDPQVKIRPYAQGGNGALGGEGALSYGRTHDIDSTGYGVPVYNAEAPGGGGACGYDAVQTNHFVHGGANGRIVIWW